MSLIDFPIEPPDEYLREIGRVVVSWNRLESLILHALILAVNGDFSNDGKQIAALIHMAFPQKLDALSAVLRIVNDDLAQKYRESYQGLLKQAQEKRNAVVHQTWHWEVDGVKRFNIKARGVLKAEIVPVKLQDLMEVSPFITDVANRFLWDICEPLTPRKNPQQGQ